MDLALYQHLGIIIPAAFFIFLTGFVVCKNIDGKSNEIIPFPLQLMSFIFIIVFVFTIGTIVGKGVSPHLN